MEQKKKNGLMLALIYLVIAVAYNLVVFLVFKDFNNIFWISYSFMVVAYLIHIGCAFSIAKNTDVKALFFGIPLGAFSIYFVLAELFTSFVFMIFKNHASVKAAVVIQALLLCVFIVIAIVSIMTRDTVQNVDKKIKENVNFVKGINVDIEMLIQRCTNPDATAALKKLSETVRYSDPMTNSIVATQEQMIMQYMAELRTVFDSGNMDSVKELCSKIELLFIERNKKLMISK